MSRLIELQGCEGGSICWKSHFAASVDAKVPFHCLPQATWADHYFLKVMVLLQKVNEELSFTKSNKCLRRLQCGLKMWQSKIWWKTPFYLFVHFMFVTAAAKTLLNKKADVKVRLVVCLSPPLMCTLHFQGFTFCLLLSLCWFLSSSIHIISHIASIFSA